MSPSRNSTASFSPVGAPDGKGAARDGDVLGGGACRHCAYNLRGLRVEGRCPECGLEIAESLDPHRLVIGSTLRDCPCRQCGYNLRGLKPDGRCPECGLEVGESLDPQRLIFVERRRLRRMVLGVLGIALIPLVAAVLIVAGTFAELGTFGLTWQQAEVVHLWLWLFFGVWIVVASWLTTTPRGGIIGETRRTRWRRRSVRLSLLAVFGSGALLTWLVVVEWWLAALTVSVVVLLAVGAVAVTLMMHAQVLAEQSDAPTTAKHLQQMTPFVGIGAGAFPTAWTVMWVIEYFRLETSSEWAPFVIGTIMIPSCLGMATSIVLALVSWWYLAILAVNLMRLRARAETMAKEHRRG